MQRVIKNFSRDLANGVRKSRFRKKITSIVLLGSAARGEWIRGESDIDLIVVVGEKKYKKPVTAFVAKVLKRLDMKYNMKLEDTCTDRKRQDNEVLKAVFRIESAVFFGVPFHVISQDEYDFIKNKVNNPEIRMLAAFMGSVNSFLMSIKETGKTIYGKNLLKDLHPRISFYDRVKIALNEIYVIIAALLVLPFDSKLAIKHALKASLYHEEFGILLLHKHLKGYSKDRKTFERIFPDKFFARHLREALYYRKNYARINPDTAEAAHFILSSMKFILIKL